MCGRYYRRSDKQKIAEAFHVSKLPSDFVLFEDYNLAPTTFQPVIIAATDTGERELVLMRWGLVRTSRISLDAFRGASTINATAETVRTSGMWRGTFARHRCLVFADGFYEWLEVDIKSKQPYLFALSDRRLFAFAGLWDAWKDRDGTWLQSFTIISTAPNELTLKVHGRMPVILAPKDHDGSRVWSGRPSICSDIRCG